MGEFTIQPTELPMNEPNSDQVFKNVKEIKFANGDILLDSKNKNIFVGNRSDRNISIDAPAGKIAFLFGETEVARMNSDSDGFMNIQSDSDMYLLTTADDIIIYPGGGIRAYGHGIEMEYNNGGGTSGFSVINHTNTALSINDTSNAYFVANVSALSFTDRTPHYEGNATEEIKQIKGKEGKNGEKEIDHATLPEFMKKVVKDDKGNEEIERNLGNAISMLLKAVAELDSRIDKLENKL